MNRVTLIGRLTNKPELRYTNSQTAYTRFTLAVKDGYGDKQRTNFIGIVAWRKLAEIIANHLDKGSQVGIDGRIQTGTYEDKNGKKSYTFDVVADNVQFLDNKKDENTKKSQIELTYETEKEEEQEEDIYSLFGEGIDDEDID